MRSMSSLLLGTVLLGSLVSCQQQEVIEETELTVTASNVIIGQDDRKETTAGSLTSPELGLENGKNFRIRVGQLITEYPSDKPNIVRQITCSAAVIGENTILTAAHCAFQEGSTNLHRNTYFVPGITEKNHMEYGRYPVKKVYLPAYYDNTDPRAEVDMAVMIVGDAADGRNVRQVVGNHGHWGQTSFPAGETLTMGYPGDKAFSTQYFEKGCYVENDYAGSNKLNVDCDVFKGQSGSPILVYSEQYKNYFVHGVITAESTSMRENYGSFISVERGRILKAIKEGNFVASNFNETWVDKEMFHDNEVRVLVKNTCSSRSALVAYRLKLMSGEWVSRGFYTVEGGETMKLPASPNGVYYFIAYDKSNNRKIITGYDDISIPGSGDHPMAKYTVKKFGDTEIKLPCAR